jgi:hypothetical protein
MEAMEAMEVMAEFLMEVMVMEVIHFIPVHHQVVPRPLLPRENDLTFIQILQYIDVI